MRTKRPLIKRIATDSLGVLMLIGAILFGWLPGPGGIPLALGGLGLLSINHDWAKKLLINIKDRSSTLYDIFFPDNKLVKAAYDIIGLLVAGFAIYLLLQSTGFVVSLAVVMLFIGLGLLLTNRRRLQKIALLSKKIKP
jgi:Putative transmembrane protein (PGPGW)